MAAGHIKLRRSMETPLQKSHTRKSPGRLRLGSVRTPCGLLARRRPDALPEPAKWSYRSANSYRRVNAIWVHINELRFMASKLDVFPFANAECWVRAVIRKLHEGVKFWRALPHNSIYLSNVRHRRVRTLFIYADMLWVRNASCTRLDANYIRALPELHKITCNYRAVAYLFIQLKHVVPRQILWQDNFILQSGGRASSSLTSSLRFLTLSDLIQLRNSATWHSSEWLRLLICLFWYHSHR